MVLVDEVERAEPGGLGWWRHHEGEKQVERDDGAQESAVEVDALAEGAEGPEGGDELVDGVDGGDVGGLDWFAGRAEGRVDDVVGVPEVTPGMWVLGDTQRCQSGVGGWSAGRCVSHGLSVLLVAVVFVVLAWLAFVRELLFPLAYLLFAGEMGGDQRFYLFGKGARPGLEAGG